MFCIMPAFLHINIQKILPISQSVFGIPALVGWDFCVLQTLSLAHKRTPTLIAITLRVLLYQSPEIKVTMKASENALVWSDFLLKLTLISIHSASSHILQDTPSDRITLCWCTLPNKLWRNPKVIHNVQCQLHLQASSEVDVQVFPQVHAKAHTQVHPHLHSTAHSQPSCLYTPKYTLKRQDNHNLTWLLLVYMLLCVRSRDLLSCSNQVLWCIMQVACGKQCLADGVWHAAGSRWQVAGCM